MTSGTLASAALRFTLRGLAVFPLAPGTKVPPAGTNGLLDASTDADLARARWARNPNANIGAATGTASGIWVLDIDPPEGPKSLAALEVEHGPLPITVEAATPRSGSHFYWRWPEDGPEIRNSVGRIGLGIDVRGDGGSIVMPPSILADGRGYQWVRNGAGTFGDAPEWLVQAALPPPPPPRREPKPLTGDVSKYVAAAVAAELRDLGNAVSGTRNESLNRAAFALAGFVLAGALPEDWARAELERRALAIGLPTIEVRKTIESAFAAAQPRSLPE